MRPRGAFMPGQAAAIRDFVKQHDPEQGQALDIIVSSGAHR
jgi:hypothetical protein